jgi:hypothetical protein
MVKNAQEPLGLSHGDREEWALAARTCYRDSKSGVSEEAGIHCASGSRSSVRVDRQTHQAIEYPGST